MLDHDDIMERREIIRKVLRLLEEHGHMEETEAWMEDHICETLARELDLED